jgi:hypothetical protein
MRNVLVCIGFSILLISCGAPSGADDYRGFIDASGFDAKFLPGRCGSTPCYTAQLGYAKGQPVSFYNVGALLSMAVPALKSTDLTTVFDIPNDKCQAVEGYDAMRDAYDSSSQFSLFSALPLAPRTGSTIFVSPFVNAIPIESADSFKCNDVKDATHVGFGDTEPKKYGLRAAAAGQVVLRAVVDPTAPLATNASLTISTKFGWYKNLLLTYLDGGPVPVNDKGVLQSMDGVILDPPAGPTTVFAKATDPKVILLPLVRGEPGYSPIVRLRSFRLPAGKMPGDYTGICSGTNCGPKDVDISKIVAAPFNTIFIVSQ